MDSYKAAAMNHGAVAGGVAYGGSIQGYPDAKPEQPKRLESSADQLMKMSSAFGDINSRLERLANRLAGAVVPEAAEKTGNITGGPTCTAHRFELSVDDFGNLLRRMDSYITRIEAL